MPHKKGYINPGLAAYHERKRLEKQETQASQPVPRTRAELKNGLKSRVIPMPDAVAGERKHQPMDEAAFNRFMGYN